MKEQFEIVYLPKFDVNCGMCTSNCDVIDVIIKMFGFDINSYVYHDAEVKFKLPCNCKKSESETWIA